jgi:uncharacterized protein (TIGR02444 family)
MESPRARVADFPDHPLWDFSLRVYGAPGVAPACLALQDRHGLDVNALMAAAWLGAAGHGPVAPARLTAMLDAVAAWHDDVVRALRAVRRRLKTPLGGEDRALAEALRGRVQKIEIDAEHVEQLALAAAAGVAASDGGAPAAARLAHACGHLAFYFRRCGAAADGADRAHLATLVGAAFPDQQAAAIAAALAAAFAAPRNGA